MWAPVSVTFLYANELHMRLFYFPSVILTQVLSCESAFPPPSRHDGTLQICMHDDDASPELIGCTDGFMYLQRLCHISGFVRIVTVIWKAAQNVSICKVCVFLNDYLHVLTSVQHYWQAL